jgi:uncharacterized protein (TIGR02186 family)
MMRAALLAVALLLPLLPGRAAAQDLVADLSSHLIAINTGFVGTDVVLFGAIDRPGDVVVVVRGPDQEAVVRRRGRVAGLWLNVQSAEFAGVPAFYVVAASERIEDIVTAPERARHQIGLADLRLEPETSLRPDQRAVFRDALVRNKQEMGVYGTAVGQVAFLGERLFRTNVYFPANVATGLYTVSAYLVRDGQVVSAQTTPLVVSKVGFSAEIFEFAQRESLYYGLLAVVGAVMAGWLAAAAFRRG